MTEYDAVSGVELKASATGCCDHPGWSPVVVKGAYKARCPRCGETREWKDTTPMSERPEPYLDVSVWRALVTLLFWGCELRLSRGADGYRLKAKPPNGKDLRTLVTSSQDLGAVLLEAGAWWEGGRWR